jgi:hypothetical protein
MNINPEQPYTYKAPFSVRKALDHLKTQPVQSLRHLDSSKNEFLLPKVIYSRAIVAIDTAGVNVGKSYVFRNILLSCKNMQIQYGQAECGKINFN